ncbi:MAG: hypothetical protein F4X32_07445 [Candidatus Dadabacteria bacterium]|nr:hypothetical protein [Candidatus Dadabacteria bacterium]
MSHTNELITFLRHYGPIPSSDNMYDELIQTEIERYGIDPPIHIRPAVLEDICDNFSLHNPRNIILTGTAGDGKTYHCRRVWQRFQGDPEKWQEGKKILSLDLPNSSKSLTIVKDLSELTQTEKDKLLPDLALAVSGQDDDSVFLVAANDGQLVATWRDWSDTQDDDARKVFKTVETMLVEDLIRVDTLDLDLYNLSHLDASEHFEELIGQIVEHPQWSGCQGCQLLNDDGSTTCPIRINRERLRKDTETNKPSAFRLRLGELLKLCRANRMHLPIRDLLLLGVNIILGDQQLGQTLLTCRTVKNRAKSRSYHLTNPFANVFGSNLSERQRQQYHVFTTLEAFGIGRETDNTFDNLLIYGPYGGYVLYGSLVANDNEYGSSAYEPFLHDYLEGERLDIDGFMRALSRQRQRLFFTLQNAPGLDPWCLTVYQSSGMFLNFVSDLSSGGNPSDIIEILIRGLNRTFCGMMIDDGTTLYLASSGGDGRGRIASLLNHELVISQQKRYPYATFRLAEDKSIPRLSIIDPVGEKSVVDPLDLQLTHFEYLVRVARGSLPASFSRQCHEDFLDFKLRIIKRLDTLIGEEPSSDEVNLQALTVDAEGRVQADKFKITVIT